MPVTTQNEVRQCMRCMLRVDENNQIDRSSYPAEFLAKYDAAPAGSKCDHVSNIQEYRGNNG